MKEYSLNSARPEDGAENLIIMNGNAGYIGMTHAHLSYMKDGSIQIKGYNPDSSSAWKKLCDFVLEPGTYTLTGLKGFQPETLELQYSIFNEEKGGYDYYSQYDEDLTITIPKKRKARLHVRIYPFTEVDTLARPAIYKEQTVDAK